MSKIRGYEINITQPRIGPEKRQQLKKRPKENDLRIASCSDTVEARWEETSADKDSQIKHIVTVQAGQEKRSYTEKHFN